VDATGLDQCLDFVGGDWRHATAPRNSIGANP
jgi:hypothetical protein